ncbi:hypothetical protein [Hymenobacter psoromatis]|uniref:hypothetical protein n=1 Tax=Hymenobacter psoromatis TaxID=1484116 RepID=UPI001CBE3CED|nr:hypothetical protein [Hymenobacter psoromatis]
MCTFWTATAASTGRVAHGGSPNNALVALTLLIAESRPEDKDVMVTLVVNLITEEN